MIGEENSELIRQNRADLTVAEADIVTAESNISTLQTDVATLHKYVPRTGADGGWDSSTFTKNGAYHTHTVARAIVPDDTVVIYALVYYKDGVAGGWINFRKDSTDTYICYVVANVANKAKYAQLIIPLDGSKDFEYQAYNGSDAVYIKILGWWVPA